MCLRVLSDGRPPAGRMSVEMRETKKRLGWIVSVDFIHSSVLFCVLFFIP